VLIKKKLVFSSDGVFVGFLYNILYVLTPLLGHLQQCILQCENSFRTEASVIPIVFFSLISNCTLVG